MKYLRDKLYSPFSFSQILLPGSQSLLFGPTKITQYKFPSVKVWSFVTQFTSTLKSNNKIKLTHCPFFAKVKRSNLLYFSYGICSLSKKTCSNISEQHRLCLQSGLKSQTFLQPLFAGLYSLDFLTIAKIGRNTDEGSVCMKVGDG